MNGYVQDERYTAGAGRAGAVPFSFAQCLTQGGGKSGDRSKGHDILFSADYADYADYCMRLAWAMRRNGAFQFCKESRYLHGRQGRTVPCFRTRCYVQDERYFAIEHRDVRRKASLGTRSRLP